MDTPIGLEERLGQDINVLKSSVTRYAIFGTLIAITALVIATILTGYILYHEISIDALIKAQQNNAALWFLDIMPFLFSYWGQRVSAKVAHDANAIVMDHTKGLHDYSIALEKKAMHDATHDTLSELPNMILIYDCIEQAIHNAKLEGLTLAILILDLDRFKEINNNLGHHNGDRLLKQVALRLANVMGDADTLARLGGDEFAFLLPKIACPKDIDILVNKIQQALEPPFELENITLDIQASIGGACFPVHGGNVDTLLQHADVAMYAARKQGVGFKLYSPELNEYDTRRLTLMGELHGAIEQDESVLHYQPKAHWNRAVI